jgi:hypothetical protein
LLEKGGTAFTHVMFGKKCKANGPSNDDEFEVA